MFGFNFFEGQALDKNLSYHKFENYERSRRLNELMKCHFSEYLSREGRFHHHCFMAAIIQII